MQLPDLTERDPRKATIRAGWVRAGWVRAGWVRRWRVRIAGLTAWSASSAVAFQMSLERHQWDSGAASPPPADPAPAGQ
jgi:hypothetical protein